MSNEGQNLRDHLVQKYGRAAVASMLDADPQNSRLHQMGRAVAIDFNDERKMVNTIQAHALVEAVKERQSQPQSQPQDGTTTTSSSSTTSHGDTTASNRLMEHLFRLYFEQAVDINDRDVLVNAARTVTGMEASDAILAMSAHNQDRIRTLDRQIKRQWNVSGVPFYIIEPIIITNNNNNADHDDETITFSGAYPINVIAEHLKKAAAVATAAATAQH